MYPYTPKPSHFFLPVIFFTIGQICIYKTWDELGVKILGIGFIATLVITWALVWDVLVRKIDATRYLLDSARHLDRERTNDLLIAMGLKPLPERIDRTTITVDKLGQHGTVEQTRIIPDVPISNEQLKKLSIALIYDGAPFSRREMADRRDIMSGDQFRQVQAIFSARGLAELKDANDINRGYVLTAFGRGVMEEYALPSPTPQPEMVNNP